MPRLLARGISAERVARITGTPAALVELIGGQENPPQAAREAILPVPSPERKSIRMAAAKRFTALTVLIAGTAATICWHEPLIPLSVAAAAIITHYRKI